MSELEDAAAHLVSSLHGQALIGTHWLGGRPSAQVGETCQVTCPYTGRPLGTVPYRIAPVVLGSGIELAQRAALAWGRTPIKERVKPLYRFRELLLRELPRLSQCAASECGKTVAEARAGIEKGIEVLEFALSLPNLDAGGSLEVSRGVHCEVRREPLGVVAGITPFNFPAMVPMWMFPLAIALGNAFVLKPSEKAPFTPLALAALLSEAGLPDGVFSVVQGGRETAEALIEHPAIAAYAFVGSSAVAGRVYAAAAARGKRVLSLGGAKNTLILAPDADPALAASGIVASFTGCAGQRCMAGSVLVAVGDCDGLIAQLIEQARRIVLGRDMGAIIDAAALSRLEAAIAEAEREGAIVALDGRRPRLAPALQGGSWLAPTILDRVAAHSRAAREELFGPVLSVIRVPTLEAALAIERESPYGNAISVFTQSGAVARRVASEAESGMVGINVGVPVPREPFSFGGTKASRFGHGDITGMGGVELWTKLKKVTSKWGAASDGGWMS